MGVAILLMAFTTGAALLIKGIWPRRRGDTYYCGYCSYDLTGSVSETCSECGSDHTTPAGRVQGLRQRRPELALMGLACLALGTILLFTPLRSLGWYQLAPAGIVLGDLQSTNPRRVARACDELGRRLKANSLSPKHRAQFLGFCLEEHAAANERLGNPKVLLQLGQAYIDGKLDPKQERRFLDQAITGTLEARRLVAPGDPVPLKLELCCRPAGVSFRLVFSVVGLDVDGQPRTAAFGLGRASESSLEYSKLFRQELLNDVPPGVHNATLRVRVRLFAAPQGPVGFPSFTVSDNPKQYWGKPIRDRVLQLTKKFEVLAEEPPDYIRQVYRSDWEDAVHKCLRIVAVRFEQTEEVGAYLDENDVVLPVQRRFKYWLFEDSWTAVGYEKLPISVAADLYVRIDGVEYLAGQAFAAKGASKIGLKWDGIRGRDKPFRKFDLILRPNDRLARESLDIYEIWGGEIVKKDIEARLVIPPANN